MFNFMKRVRSTFGPHSNTEAANLPIKLYFFLKGNYTAKENENKTQNENKLLKNTNDLKNNKNIKR